jgi:hypothetical protein
MPKKYELQQIFQMPGRGAFGFSAADTGTFIHEVLEFGVKNCFDSKNNSSKKQKNFQNCTNGKA